MNNCMSNRQGNFTSKASVILPIGNAITWHKNTCDSMLITVPIAAAFLNLKKVCTYKKCAVMEMIALLSIRIPVYVLFLI